MLDGRSPASIPIATGVWSHPPARLSSLYLRRSSLTEDPARPASNYVRISATSLAVPPSAPSRKHRFADRVRTGPVGQKRHFITYECMSRSGHSPCAISLDAELWSLSRIARTARMLLDLFVASNDDVRCLSDR
jgi:hypothetical protein